MEKLFTHLIQAILGLFTKKPAVLYVQEESIVSDLSMQFASTARRFWRLPKSL